ncbi:MAG: lipid-binding SYLF domain-containing protein [Nitrospirota bacterium]|nr:MAG: lipid-binding SYLF domain-containing protein [Nitrospirota bacterium]
MKKIPAVGLIAALMVVMFMISGCATWNPNKAQEERSKAAETIRNFKTKDPSINQFFSKAYGYAVFPTVGKGGAVIGGAYGKGTVYERGRVIGTAKIVQVTVGFQLGGQGFSEIIFFKDKATMDNFKKGELKLSAQASAVAVTAGAATKATWDKGVAVFVMTKGGLMYEATVGGQGFDFDPI